MATPSIVWDNTDKLTTPQFIKTYQEMDGKNQALVVVRLRDSGTTPADKEMDIEVRCYWWKLLEKAGPDLPRKEGQLHPCCTVHKLKLKAPARLTSPLADQAAWQVLADDVRNGGKPELVFLVGRGISEYSVQIFGFDDDGTLTERNVDVIPALPTTLPTNAASWANTEYSKFHLTALRPNEKV